MTSARSARARLTPRRAAAALLALGLLAYAAALVWLMSRETDLVFRAPAVLGEARPPFVHEEVQIPRADGARQFGWTMPAEGGGATRPWLLFLHGNASSIASRFNIDRYRELRALGLNVLAPEYRGFAGLDGTPTEAGLAADARAAFEYLTEERGVAPSRVVIYGWSLGSAVAVHLASGARPGAVILEGAPASVAGIGQQQYPYFPIRLVMRNPFESIRRIDRVKAPLLFLHSPEDTIVPIAEGRALYQAAAPPKRFVEVRGGHIRANEVDGPVFFGAIREFLADHGLLERGE